MKSKQLLLTEKCIWLTIMFVCSVYKLTKIHLYNSLNFTANSYFSKIALSDVSIWASDFRCKQSFFLMINKDISNTWEKLKKKSQSITDSCRCGKCGIMDTNVECLSCDKVEVLGYFQLLDMRYDDRNVVIEIVYTTVLPIYLIWTPVHILEHVLEFQRLI